MALFRKEKIQEISEEDVLAKYDRDSNLRRLDGVMAKIIFTICLGWSLFQLYTAVFGTFASTIQRATHLGAALILVYLLYPAKKGKSTGKIPWYDYLLAFLSFVVSLYHLLFFEQLQLRAGMYKQLDVVISVIAVLLILEATRRVSGIVVVILAGIFLLYALLGQDLPGFLGHARISIKRLSTFQWLSTEAILGSPMYVSSTFIFLFLLFATFLKKSGVGDWMTNLAMGACGGAVGGPAKAAVVASALQGTLTGSSVANTVSTGSITIPLMKNTGYKGEFAGAVEAASSTGGQLMPPIMGAAAFIMTEYIGCTYATVALAACIPALLYFTGIFTNVHFEALKNGLRGIPKDQKPKIGMLIKTGWYMILPIVLIVAFLIAGATPMKAALYGIIACVVIWLIEMLKTEKKLSMKKFGKDFFYSLEEGAKSAISVAITCGAAGIIVGVITLTGLGLRLANGIVTLAGGSLLLTMFLTMICSIVLGMGVPTTANYIIQATISAPAMIALGVHPVAAHLFVFYFGIVADITPPVALAAFAGAGIAGANPMKTGFNAFRLGFAAYLVPYIFALNPQLVLVRPEGANVVMFAVEILFAIFTAVMGMIAIASGFSGYLKTDCNVVERIVLVATGLMLIIPTTITDIIGVCVLITVYLLQRKRSTNSSYSVNISKADQDFSNC